MTDYRRGRDIIEAAQNGRRSAIADTKRYIYKRIELLTTTRGPLHRADDASQRISELFRLRDFLVDLEDAIS